MSSPPARPAGQPAEDTPFSVARLRGGLAWFAVGKIVAGLIGIAWLLTLVRLLSVPHYGGYVVLLALLEIVLLVSNAGVYPFAQRYITEARLPANLPALPRLVWQSLAYRLVTLALAAIGLALAAPHLSGWIGQPLLATVLPIYGLVIVCEGAARYLELVFESMLEQGRAQFCAVLRNGARLLCALLLAAASDRDLTLVDVIHIEVATSAFGLLLAMGVAWQSLRQLRSQVVPAQERAGADFGWRRLTPFALPLFVAQCLTQLYSPDTLKLIVSRLLGATEAAVFGFAHALSFVLQRYLPANLLIGLIRPMLVARRAHRGDDQELVLVGNLVLKINHFLLLPLAALFAVAGQDFAELASAGKYSSAGPVLCLLTLLLIPAGTHVVLAMLATALEDRRAVLLGTLVSIPGVLLGIMFGPRWGSTAMAAGLWLSELLWCGFTLALLRYSGFTFRIDAGAWLKLVFAAVAAAALALGCLQLWPSTGANRLLTAAAVIAVAYSITCWALRPLSAADLALLLRLLPGRWRPRSQPV